MAQTDRQTDKFDGTATHWKSGIFDVEDNWSVLQAPPPEWIRFVKFKKEVCPTTGKEHFQTHVCCRKQVRLKKICSWLKHTKWFPVIGEQHIRNSIAYIDKKETTAPGAEVQINQSTYIPLHELLLTIARYANCNDDMNEWRWITARMIAVDIMWANKLSNPALRNMWKDWGHVFIRKVEEYSSDTCGAFIIEAPPEAALPSAEVEDPYEFLEE